MQLIILLQVALEVETPTQISLEDETSGEVSCRKKPLILVMGSNAVYMSTGNTAATSKVDKLFLKCMCPSSPVLTEQVVIVLN